MPKAHDPLPECRVRTVANGYVIEVRPCEFEGALTSGANVYVARNRAELCRVIAKLAMDVRVSGDVSA